MPDDHRSVHVFSKTSIARMRADNNIMRIPNNLYKTYYRIKLRGDWYEPTYLISNLYIYAYSL